MADTSTGAPAVTPAAADNSWEKRIWSIGKNIAIFVAVQFAIKQFMGSGGQKAATSTPPPAMPRNDGTQPATEYSAIPQSLHPLWPNTTSVDIDLYISPSIVMPPFSNMPPESRILSEKSFHLEKGKKDNRDISTSFSVPKQVQNNGTLWAHIFVGQPGAVLDPASSDYDSAKAYRMLRPLTQYLTKKKIRKTRNLLGGSDETEVPEDDLEDKGPMTASYYHPNFTLSFIPDTGVAAYPQMHPAMRQFYVLETSGARDATGQNGYYYPVVYVNTFWQLRSHMVELNRTIPIDRLDMNVHLSTLSSWQFGIMASMDESMKETARKAALGESSPGGGDGSEMEMIKETLLDTNPWLLGTTVVVSVLHMIFELLAFKSDVGHWRNKKDNVGVSVRTILSNVVMQTIIFLYLMDNNENTSWMILFGQGMGIAIEAWKITKTVNIRLREPTPAEKAQTGMWGVYFSLPTVVVFENKHELSETEEKTEEYDRIAFKWMGIGAVPLLIAYAIYSLVYDTHKSWYSFTITTLVGSVYAYGFLMMVRLYSHALDLHPTNHTLPIHRSPASTSTTVSTPSPTCLPKL